MLQDLQQAALKRFRVVADIDRGCAAATADVRRHNVRVLCGRWEISFGAGVVIGEVLPAKPA